MKNCDKCNGQIFQLVCWDCVLMTGWLWSIPFVFMMVIGIIQGLQDSRGTCEKPIRKIEYIYPGHIFGCWLTKVAE